jgi:hypothetical protein
VGEGPCTGEESDGKEQGEEEKKEEKRRRSG